MPNTDNDQNQQTSQESQRLMDKLNMANLPIDMRRKVEAFIRRVDALIKGSNYKEYELIENYINWVTRIPFGVFSNDNLDLQNAKEVLDKNHFGLEDVKNKLLEFVSVIKLNESKNFETDIVNAGGVNKMKLLKGSSANAPVMLFIGIQGIGKTSLAKSIASAIGRKFVRVSLGGMASVDELRGRARGSNSAGPGQVLKALVNTGVMNPLVLFDELDKVSDSGGVRMDIMASLLEILDPEQNSTFVDRYIDSPVDVSKCLFIATANNLGGITSALLDRMELVRFSSYSDEDKKQIAQRYLLPKIRQATGLGEDQLVFHDDVWDMIIRPLGFDAGIRELERNLTNIARKVAMKIVQGQGKAFNISPENFREYIPDDFGVFT